ncbi:oligosaccharide repeat unit polymerase [Acinetobacter nematophilus]|uniref:oligosaccharide repeat unit polymerase n=1 Tax=Acinetobacter nematophilus TaxID=2994642 RepID=UPI003AF43587
MREIRINPFYFLAIFYLLINFVYAVSGYQNGEMEIEFQRKVIDSTFFVYAFLFQSIAIFIIIFAYKIFSKKIKEKDSFIFGSQVGFFLLIGQLFYFLVNMYFGANIAGDSSQYKGNFLINIFFILLPFDILFFIFGICLKSSKLFFLNSILYLVSNLVRGWMGTPLLLFFAILCRKESLKLNVKAFILYFCFVVFIIALSPYLMELKWVVRGKLENSSIIENVNNYGYVNYLLDTIDYIFNRFQHVGHVALIFENQDFLNEKYNLGYIVPYWGEGLPQSIFMNIFNVDSFMTLPRFLTIQYFSASLATSWTVNIGMAGWFIILKMKFIIFLLYMMLVVYLPFYFVSKFGNRKLFLMLSCFSLFYLFHGWIYAYITFLLYLILIIIFKRAKV